MWMDVRVAVMADARYKLEGEKMKKKKEEGRRKVQKRDRVCDPYCCTKEPDALFVGNGCGGRGGERGRRRERCSFRSLPCVCSSEPDSALPPHFSFAGLLRTLCHCTTTTTLSHQTALAYFWVDSSLVVGALALLT